MNEHAFYEAVGFVVVCGYSAGIGLVLGTLIGKGIRWCIDNRHRARL